MSISRTKNLHLTLSEIELQRLQVLAKHEETTMAAYLRSLIKREWQKGPTENGRTE
jgi:predicted DNA-binding protein